MHVDSSTTAVIAKDTVGEVGAEGGSAGVLVSADFVCFEVTGLVLGTVYEFKVIAKNNNVDASQPSQSFFHMPTQKPRSSPPSTSISVVMQGSTRPNC